MSLPFGLLGLLRYQDSTGYDLTKRFEASLNKFWHAQSSQIYRELNRLEEKGWVTSKTIFQEGKPNKRLYSITDNGQEAFMKWMREPALLFENRHTPFMMYVFFGAAAPEETLRRIKGVRDALTAAIREQGKEMQENIDKHKTSLHGSEKESLYWQMTLDLGIAEAKALLEWSEKYAKILEGKPS